MWTLVATASPNQTGDNRNQAIGSAEQTVSGTAVPDLRGVPLVNGKPRLATSPSAADEVAALGAPPDVVAKFAAMDSQGRLSQAAPAARKSSVAPRIVTPMDETPSNQIGHTCQASSADSGMINMYSCDTT